MRQRDGIIDYDVTSGVLSCVAPGYFVWKSTGIARAFGHTVRLAKTIQLSFLHTLAYFSVILQAIRTSKVPK